MRFNQCHVNDDYALATLIFAAVLPFLLMLAMFIMNKTKSGNESGLILFYHIIFFMICPALIKIYLEWLYCRQIDSEHFLMMNFDLKCWEGSHLYIVFAIAIPSLLLWIVGVNSYIALKLKKTESISAQINLKRYQFNLALVLVAVLIQV